VSQDRAGAGLGVVCHAALERGSRPGTEQSFGVAIDAPTIRDVYQDFLPHINIVLSVNQGHHLTGVAEKHDCLLHVKKKTPFLSIDHKPCVGHL
jgi:hypothetical protein